MKKKAKVAVGNSGRDDAPPDTPPPCTTNDFRGEEANAVSAEALVASPSFATSPTPTELALIAAAIRGGQVQDWPSLASDAHTLWEACAKEILKRKDRRRRRLDELFADIPKPRKFPVPLKEFLELMLPKKRADDRLRAYRHFLMEHYGGDPAKLIAQHKAEPAREFLFNQRAYMFGAWLAADLRAKRSLAGSRGGRKGPERLSPAEVQAAEKKAAERRKQDVDAAWQHVVDAYASDVHKMGVF